MKALNYKIIIPFVGILFWLSCNSTKNLYKGKVPVRSESELLQAIHDHNFDFEWFTGKADVKVDSPFASGSGDIWLRIKKDSLIWLVGKKLGIEGLRLQIMPDKYEAIFRLDNSYKKGKVNQLSKQIGVPFQFEDLQNLMVGNVFLIDSTMVKSINLNKYIYSISSTIDGLNITYNVNAFTLLLDDVFIEELNGRKVRVAYFDYKKIDDINIAHNLSVNYNEGENNSSLDLKFKEIEFNQPKKTPFSIPSHYDRIY